MADVYNLYLYKEVETKWGTARLNIYQKQRESLKPLPSPIGDVLVSLNYGIQGAEDAVDNPIQKTSLDFSLVDAPERNTANETWGGWESFYTSDATAYKVELVVDDVVRWTGFITPDSWEEDLTWHAPVTITARDNWGRLNDFTFDHPGNEDHLISVQDLLFAAAEKAGVVMDVNVNEGVPWPTCSGFPLYEHMVNVCAFEEKTWWDALYDTLASLGLCLAYVDNNAFSLAPLGFVSYKGREDYEDVNHVEFYFNGGGHRSLAPAVKEILETQNYDFSDDMINAPELTIDDFQSGSTYPFTTQPYGTTERAMPVFSLKPERFWKQQKNTYNNLLCQWNYLPRENDDAVRLQDGKTLFIACNPGTATDYATAHTKMGGVYCELNLTRMRGQISFRVGAPVRLYGNYETGTAAYSEQYTCPVISSIYARIYFTPVGGSPKCFNGQKWVTGNAPCNLTPPTNDAAVYEYEFVIPSADVDSPGVLHIEFICGRYIIYGDYEQTDPDGKGMYMPITDIKMTRVWETEAENKVTTKFDDLNNIILERRPEIGCLNYDTMSPNEVINGVYTPTTGCPASRQWMIGDDELLQLPALIHKQLICWYYKPNNVITGTLIDKEGNMPSFSGNWLWRGQKHYLMSGRVNILNGQMEGATLREFYNYNELW